MSRLFESIKCQDGELLNLACHEKRFNRARYELFGEEVVPLAGNIRVPDPAKRGLFKCRVSYAEQITKVEFIQYIPKTIRSLRIVYADDIDYSHKYTDRSEIEELFAQRGGCDDILIVKKGRITDTSYCNVLFFDGKKWLTPVSPLLKGTQRAKLIADGVISEEEILLKDLKLFKKVQLINAMLEFNQGRAINISGIYK